MSTPSPEQNMPVGKRRPQLEDIAQASRVSASTVSRALRNKPGVSARVRAKIERVAEAYHYVPNHHARALAIGRTDTIGLVTPPLEAMTPQPEANERLERLADTDGKRIMHVSYAREECMTLARLAQAHRWDGLLLYPYTASVARTELGEVIDLIGIPVVVLGGPLSEWADSVTHDRTHGTRLLLDHLASLGRRKLLLVCGGAEWAQAEGPGAGHNKYVRFREELAARNMEMTGFVPLETPAAHGRQLYQATCEAFREKWRRDWEADVVMARNDLTAAAVVNVLRDEDVRVPEDVAVTGYDDAEWSMYVRPPLTTIRSPLEEMMEMGWTMLKQRLDGDDRPPRHVTLQPALVARASTGEVGDDLAARSGTAGEEAEAPA